MRSLGGRCLCWIAALVHLFCALRFSCLTITQSANSALFPAPLLQTVANTTISAGVWLLLGELPKQNGTGIAQSLDLQMCPLAFTTTAMNNKYVVKQVMFKGSGSINTRVLIILFRLLSFWFQGYASWCSKPFYEPLDDTLVISLNTASAHPSCSSPYALSWA